MTGKSYGVIHRLMQGLASSRFGAWYFSLTQQHLDALFHGISGRTSATTFLAGLPVVMVTTRGAKTGKARTVPLLYIQGDDTPDEFAVVGTNFGQSRIPAWHGNLTAHPEARCTFEGVTKPYLAHAANEDEYARYWRLAEETYLGFPKYRQRIADRRQIPIMVMRLAEDATAPA